MNSRTTVAMQGPDFCLTLDQAYIHGLNEELGRRRSREDKVECSICGAGCESVVHILWECPAYTCISCREGFRAKFKELI